MNTGGYRKRSALLWVCDCVYGIGVRAERT